MISFFGVASLVVFLLCVVCLVLFYYLMKRRTRLDIAIQELEISGFDENGKGDFEAKTKEYADALADYKTCISRFPFYMITKILNLPHE